MLGVDVQANLIDLFAHAHLKFVAQARVFLQELQKAFTFFALDNSSSPSADI